MNTQKEKSCYVKRCFIVVTILLTMLVSFGNPVLAQSNPKAAKELSNAFSTAAKEAMPAVVSIKVEKTIEANPLFGTPNGYNDPYGPFGDDLLRQFFGDRMPQQQQTPRKYSEQGQGSGFIISSDGYILTNNHVVGDVDKITVELQDGRTFENAKLIGTDPDSEVALIKIDGNNFPVLPMGNSDNIEIGDWVIAIGNPFGLNETVTVGVISAVGRSNVHIAAYEDFIQTDAAINPGNSGGPLINLDGKVIGINTAIFSESGGYMGIGFAIPVNMARSIEKQLKENGRVTRGYLGIYGQDITPDMAQLLNIKNSQGVIVASVEKGSPADKAGLKSHDVLLEMNGEKIESYDSFRNAVAVLKPGSNLRLSVLRNGDIRDINITLGTRPTEVAQNNQNNNQNTTQGLMGIQVQNVTKELSEQFGYIIGEGVVITSVTPGSPAANAGLQPGDLIESVNRNVVTSVDDFEASLKKATGNKILLLIKRGEFSQFIIVKLES